MKELKSRVTGQRLTRDAGSRFAQACDWYGGLDYGEHDEGSATVRMIQMTSRSEPMDESREYEYADDEANTSHRAAHCPTLSVVLLSHGDRTELERALESIAGRCRRLEAEIIVVRARLLDDAETLKAAYPCVIFLDAPRGTASAEMRDIGMNYASGDIVALRMDGAVGDGMWLGAFNSMVGRVSEPPHVEIEVPLLAVPGDLSPSAERRKSKAYATPTVTATSKRRIDLLPRLSPLVASREMETSSAPLTHEM